MQGLDIFYTMYGQPFTQNERKEEHSEKEEMFFNISYLTIDVAAVWHKCNPLCKRN